jgi:hypothetical protein
MMPNQIAAPEAKQHFEGFAAVLNHAAFVQRQRRWFILFSQVFVCPFRLLDTDSFGNLECCTPVSVLFSLQVHYFLLVYVGSYGNFEIWKLQQHCD